MRNESCTFKSLDLNADRTELHDLLKLTGCEVSINNMAPNTQVPFFHYHKENEEVKMRVKDKGAGGSEGESERRE